MSTKEEVIQGMTQDNWERQKNITWTEAQTQVENQMRRWIEDLR